MIRIVAKGNESGIWQPLTPPGTAVMLTAWVFVRSGHLAMQSSAGLTGPYAWNDKLNEWEELRICTNGTVPVDNIVIYNQDPNGGDFLIGFVKPGLNGLRAKFGGYRSFFRTDDVRLRLLQGSRCVLKLAIEFIDDFAARTLGGVPLLFGELQFAGEAFAK